MTKERKKILAYLIVVIFLFGTGFGLGYYFWGVDREKGPDYKKNLSKTIKYIGNLEKNNQDLLKQIKGVKSEVEAIKKELKGVQSRAEAQSKTLQTKTAFLKKEKAKSQSLFGQNQKLSKEKKKLQGKIDQLINKFDIDIESPVSKEKGAAKQEAKPPVSKEKIPVEDI